MCTILQQQSTDPQMPLACGDGERGRAIPATVHSTIMIVKLQHRASQAARARGIHEHTARRRPHCDSNAHTAHALCVHVVWVNVVPLQAAVDPLVVALARADNHICTHAE